MKYRKKPVEIEAMQLTADNACEVLTFCNGSGDIVASKEDDGTISIKTLEGTMIASIGDYVIKGVKGEFYPCKPDIFEATYDKIDEALEAIPADWEMEICLHSLQAIVEKLDQDPRIVYVSYEREPKVQLCFKVDYANKPEDVYYEKEASFTLYEGTTIALKDGYYVSKPTFNDYERSCNG